MMSSRRSEQGGVQHSLAVLGWCHAARFAGSLGAPVQTDRALHAELEIGLLLPCNVIVYETSSNRSVVAAMAPLVALGIVGANPVLQDVAREADERLRRALTAIEVPPSK